MRRFRFKGIAKDYCNSVLNSGLKKGEIYSFDFMIGSAFFENVLWGSERYPEDWEEVIVSDSVVTWTPINDGWISVDDQLPNVGVECICNYFPKQPIMQGTRIGLLYRITHKTAVKISTDKNGFTGCSEVTHWMPLPKPPTK